MDVLLAKFCERTWVRTRQKITRPSLVRPAESLYYLSLLYTKNAPVENMLYRETFNYSRTAYYSYAQFSEFGLPDDKLLYISCVMMIAGGSPRIRSTAN